ncbi:MAG: hypothetical protein JJE05_05950 [Actinobacteria bacterium]|nr:hypothetical protein [Actinomycetota bacterium]
MRFKTILAVAVVAIVALVPSPASAGGWLTYIDLPGGHLGVGETVRVRTEVTFQSRQEAEAAQAMDFHVYLVREVNTDALARTMGLPNFQKWWTPPTDMTLVGDVVFDRWDVNIARATSDLTVPEMPPGQYQLLFCDPGCQYLLANVSPQEVSLSADPLLARTARGLLVTQARLDLSLARVRSDLRQTARRAKGTEAMAGNSVEAITGLRKEITSLEADPPAIPWIAFAGWFVGGAVVALLATQLRRRVRRVLPEAPVERVPGEERELVSSR